MSQFFPALAHTDTIGYFDSEGKRRLMSVRSLLPQAMASKFLVSLSFNESVHYASNDAFGNLVHRSQQTEPDISTVFVDCGAFHYVNDDAPKFKRGGYVTSKTAFDEYMNRHVKHNPNVEYLLCSPDHIILQGASNEDFSRRRDFILRSAEGFLKRVEGIRNITPIGVVHGRDAGERAEIAMSLIQLGYDYLAFGGLVPISRNAHEVLNQIGGVTDLTNPTIDPKSALGLCMSNGCRTHMFGLNSPEWYRWWRRIGVTSFDGSKLSQEGAANGIIWVQSFQNPNPMTSRDLYDRLQIKNIKSRQWVQGEKMQVLKTSADGSLNFSNPAWDYLMNSRCTSQRCPQSHVEHNCDPRVTGSIEHNMGRMVLNAHTFEELMLRIDKLCDLANSEPIAAGKEWLKEWKRVEVG